MHDCDGLLSVIRGTRRLLIYLHDNPDPDALAAGWLLRGLSLHEGVRARVIYGGRLGRAENRTLVKLLKIPARRLDELSPRLLAGDRYALVDCQPGTGNNSFPHQRRRLAVVLDHHPLRVSTRADFVDVRTDGGCTTTLMLRYAEECRLHLDARLATACAYAIISETQDLGREAARADREALQRLMPQADLRILGHIRHPAREREYYRTIAHALNRVQVGQNTCVCHIGPVPYPEVVAEVADFLMAMRRVTWCLVSGQVGAQAVLSIRTSNPRAHAERLMRRLLGVAGKGGGHGMIAGGLLNLSEPTAYEAEAGRLTARFLALLPRRAPEALKPLLEPEGGAPTTA